MSFWERFTPYREKVISQLKKDTVEIVATQLRDGEGVFTFSKDDTECRKMYEDAIKFLSDFLTELQTPTFLLLSEIRSAIESFYRPVNFILGCNLRYEVNFKFLICELAKESISLLDTGKANLSTITILSLPIQSSLCLRCLLKTKDL